MKFFFTLSFACVATILAETPTDKSAAVLQAEHNGCAAYLHGDADKIAKFLTDDYTLTNSKAKSARPPTISKTRGAAESITMSSRITI
jgi:hypothetical protein